MSITPRPLRPGDTIAVVSPASHIRSELIDGAAMRLTEAGYRVRVMPHARQSTGNYAGNETDRIADMVDAMTDPDIRAVLCSRGGYGCVHLLDALDRLDLTSDPKWLIGFSDVSALHALMQSRGIMSIHSSMAKGLATHQTAYEPNRRLLSLLDGKAGDSMTLTWSSHPYNHPGCAVGPLAGGNLAVIQALIATRFDPIRPGSILIIEDIAEPIYKVERIIMQLALAGRLDTLAGLIIGQFTEYSPDANHDDMYTMLAHRLASVKCPVAFNAPVGHIDGNMPLVLGSEGVLTVGDTGSVSLTMRLTPGLTD